MHQRKDSDVGRRTVARLTLIVREACLPQVGTHGAANRLDVAIVITLSKRRVAGQALDRVIAVAGTGWGNIQAVEVRRE